MPSVPGPTRPVVIVSGFEPFGGGTRNVSAEAAQAVAHRPTLSHRAEIIAITLPVVYDVAATMIRDAIAAHRPAVVVATGIHRNPTFRLETVARNRDDSAMPDNVGVTRVSQSIDAQAPALIPATWPLPTILERLTQRGLPVTVSDSAGGFLCNHVFFHLMQHTTHIATAHAAEACLAGFVHVPPLAEGDTSSLTVADVVDALEIVVSTCLDTLGPRSSPTSPW